MDARRQLAARDDVNDAESVPLRKLRAIFADVMAIAKFSNLEDRLAQFEEDYREQNGSPDHVA